MTAMDCTNGPPDTTNLVVIVDESALAGNSVKEFVEKLVSLAQIQWVWVRDVLGNTRGFSSQAVELDAEEFLKRVGNAVQYDWAFFFMFASRPGIIPDQTDDKSALMR